MTSKYCTVCGFAVPADHDLKQCNYNQRAAISIRRALANMQAMKEAKKKAGL